jgi:hypothetical protein
LLRPYIDAVQLLPYLVLVPTIQRFASTRITMYAEDHNPPHFHIVGEPMPAEEFREWQAGHKLSLTGAAKVLGLSRRMVQYYATGAKPIPKTVRLACRGATLELVGDRIDVRPKPALAEAEAGMVAMAIRQIAGNGRFSPFDAGRHSGPKRQVHEPRPSVLSREPGAGRHAEPPAVRRMRTSS